MRELPRLDRADLLGRAQRIPLQTARVILAGLVPQVREDALLVVNAAEGREFARPLRVGEGLGAAPTSACPPQGCSTSPKNCRSTSPRAVRTFNPAKYSRSGRGVTNW